MAAYVRSALASLYTFLRPSWTRTPDRHPPLSPEFSPPERFAYQALPDLPPPAITSKKVKALRPVRHSNTYISEQPDSTKNADYERVPERRQLCTDACTTDIEAGPRVDDLQKRRKTHAEILFRLGFLFFPLWIWGTALLKFPTQFPNHEMSIDTRKCACCRPTLHQLETKWAKRCSIALFTLLAITMAIITFWVEAAVTSSTSK
ncbi:hypothetical protein OF83DRAFT_1168223 [Amylostereum chailletii]|nr:hypothetical protein OF83DRAFT_1168223 [Amylostereum chailletii]